MSNKVYAVVDTTTGVVFAKLFVRRHDYVKLGNIRVGVRECWNKNPNHIIKIIDARLSSSQGDIDKINLLDTDTFINDTNCYQKDYDYILHVNNPEAFEQQFLS